MNPTEQAAQAFLELSKSWESDAIRAALKELPDDVQGVYRKLKRASFFTPENAGKSWEELSPSGKYKLVITSFATGGKSWSFTQGTVFSIGSDTPIAVVQRNYHSFPFLFVEGHAKGDFLVCGEDYQGQTVVELGSGQRRDFLPDSAKQGHGFCWVGYEYVPSMQVLLVEGCYWACPYEFRLYDFSDPMNGMAHLGENEKIWIDADQRKPTFEADGSVKVYQTEFTDDDDDDEEEETEKELPPVAAYTVYRREGQSLVQVEAWVSEKEQDRRARRAENERLYQERMKKLRAEDPLFLAYAEHLKDTLWDSKDSYEGVGVTYPNWCPDFKVEEQRMCRRIFNRKEPKLSIDLEWGTATGPVKVQCYRDGKTEETRFFPHSAEGMHEAFAFARTVAS